MSKNRSSVPRKTQPLEKPIQWCHYLVKAGYATVAVIILAHVLWYFAAHSILAYPPDIYRKNYIILPGIGLLFLNFTIDRFVRSHRIPLIVKEYAVLILFVIFSFYLSLTHKIASVLLSSFILPIFASTIFSNIKMTRRIFILSNPLMFFSGIKTYFAYNFDHRIPMEIFVAWDMLICSYLLAKVLIRYGKENLVSLVNSYHQQKRMEERLKLDSYTNLYNKKTFDDYFPALYEKCKNNHIPLCLAIIDIDHFKQINDVYGHIIGDRVLLYLTQIFKSNETENIKIFRIGGEEFALTFQNHLIEDALHICEKMRFIMESSIIPDIDKKGVTFSCGLVCSDKRFSGPHNLAKAADTALYTAKNQGRNQVAIYDRSSQPDGTDKPHPG